MDNVDPKREPKRENDGLKKNELLQEDARQSFFQLENLMFNTDAKSFGLVAIDTLLVTVSGYFLDKTSNELWYVPAILFCASLFSLLVCAMPRRYERRWPTIPLNRAAKETSELVAAQMAVDYADLTNKLETLYDEKIQFFLVGSLLTLIGFVLSVMMFISSF